MSIKSINVSDHKIDYSEPTQDEIDRLLYDDIHIRVNVNVNSVDDTIIRPIEWSLA